MSMFGGMFNRAPKAAPQDAAPKFRDEDPEMYNLLRDQIQKSAVNFDKKHLIEDAGSLDMLTERVARALRTHHEVVDESVLGSQEFTDTLAKALAIEPAPKGPEYVVSEGQVVTGIQDTKVDVLKQTEGDRQADVA